LEPGLGPKIGGSKNQFRLCVFLYASRFAVKLMTSARATSHMIFGRVRDHPHFGNYSIFFVV